MGCSTSRLDDEEAIQLCKDRNQFIKQAVEHRARFASGHLAYIQSLKRVSSALREYVEEDRPHEFLSDSFVTPSLTPLKKARPGFVPKPFTLEPILSRPNPTSKVNYLISGGNPAVSVEERPQSPEVVRVASYSPIHQSGFDSLFPMQTPPMSSSFYSYSPNYQPNVPPPSPPNSQWDFFWNPFSSLDFYGYPTRSSLDQANVDDEIRQLRQVREEEGIPDLEEDETEQEDSDNMINVTEERAKINSNRTREDRGKINSDYNGEYVTVEDVEEEDTDCESHSDQEMNEVHSHGSSTVEVSHVQNSGQVVSKQETAVEMQETEEETPGFTVYVNRRPTSMSEIIKDLEAQFKIICNSANEVSSLLEATRAWYSSASNDLTAIKMLNPVNLLRSASSHSSSSRFLMNSSSSRDEGYENSSDFSEESCMLSGSHQSTLDRLYAWEKKLYKEVRSGERVRIAYEKKCNQLKNQDIKGVDPFAIDKTRAAIRDLHTQIKVSIHSVEAISKRIETLRDEELHPQLLELIRGLTRMWKVMAECHQRQKRTLDEAKLLLARTPSKLDARKQSYMSVTDPERLARSAANLETELRNWRDCFKSWITAQRSYVHALTGWLLRCVRSDPDTSKLPLSPRRSTCALPIFGLCIQWSRLLDSIRKMPVLEGLGVFAAGIGSLYALHFRDDSRQMPVGSKRFTMAISAESGHDMKMVEHGQVEEVMTPEKMAAVAIRVLCAGMSVAMGSLSEFSVSSAEGYTELVKQWESSKMPNSSRESECR